MPKGFRRAGKSRRGVRGREGQHRFMLHAQLEFEVDKFSWFSHITRKGGEMGKARNVPRPVGHTAQAAWAELPAQAGQEFGKVIHSYYLNYFLQRQDRRPP